MGDLSQGKIPINTGVLVVDTGRKMVSFNRKFIELWTLPQSIIVSQHEWQAIDFVCEQVKDSKSFLKSVQEAYINIDLELHDTINLKNGKILERYSLPQYLESKYVGRIWKFREISDSKFSTKVISTKNNFNFLYT